MLGEDDGLPGVIVENPVHRPPPSCVLQLQFSDTSPFIFQEGLPNQLYLPFVVTGCNSNKLECSGCLI